MLKRTRYLLVVASLLALLIPGSAGAAPGNAYTVVNLVSDQSGVAAHLDANLVNAWGLAAGPTSPWWVADNGMDVSTLYDGSGVAQFPTQTLVVDVPSEPTGVVFNGGSSFVVSDGVGDSGPARFLFATEEGAIRGWNPTVPPSAPLLSTQTFPVASGSDGAIYKGLAIASTGSGDFLYATDFHNDRVDMFDGTFQNVTPDGAFVDPRMPSGFAPFGIQNIDGTLFVTYAKQDADAEDDVAGPSLGFVDRFSTGGQFLGRVAGRGRLDSPWGLAMAPGSFGAFAGDLLVGNFGDGRINAFAPLGNGRFAFQGQLASGGAPITIDGLWALRFGNDAAAGPSGTLFFTAGPDEESHGLFGSIAPAA